MAADAAGIRGPVSAAPADVVPPCETEAAADNREPARATATRLAVGDTAVSVAFAAGSDDAHDDDVKWGIPFARRRPRTNEGVRRTRTQG